MMEAMPCSLGSWLDYAGRRDKNNQGHSIRALITSNALNYEEMSRSVPPFMNMWHSCLFPCNVHGSCWKAGSKRSCCHTYTALYDRQICEQTQLLPWAQLFSLYWTSSSPFISSKGLALTNLLSHPDHMLHCSWGMWWGRLLHFSTPGKIVGVHMNSCFVPFRTLTRSEPFIMDASAPLTPAHAAALLKKQIEASSNHNGMPNLLQCSWS
jgi:hypothetical protein